MSVLASRRAFLGAGAALSLAAAIPAIVRSRPPGNTGRAALADNFSRRNFEAYLGEEFAVGDGSAAPRLLRLAEVSGSSGTQCPIDCFDLVFAGGRQGIAGGVMTFYHPQAGSFQLHLSGGSGEMVCAHFALLNVA